MAFSLICLYINWLKNWKERESRKSFIGLGKTLWSAYICNQLIDRDEYEIKYCLYTCLYRNLSCDKKEKQALIVFVLIHSIDREYLTV